jgi:hypothetical protein
MYSVPFPTDKQEPPKKGQYFRYLIKNQKRLLRELEDNQRKLLYHYGSNAAKNSRGKGGSQTEEVPQTVLCE